MPSYIPGNALLVPVRGFRAVSPMRDRPAGTCREKSFRLVVSLGDVPGLVHGNPLALQGVESIMNDVIPVIPELGDQIQLVDFSPAEPADSRSLLRSAPVELGLEERGLAK